VGLHDLHRYETGSFIQPRVDQILVLTTASGKRSTVLVKQLRGTFNCTSLTNDLAVCRHKIAENDNT